MADERKQLVRDIIHKRKYHTYLEIGVLLGSSFFPVKAKRKIAVDPQFLFTKRMLVKAIAGNIRNFVARYYQVTSDEFFKKRAGKLFKRRPIDICFIDGMHEYDYALRDAENVLNYLQDDGMIILHDCNPASAEATVSFREWENRNRRGNWNGDVWKTIVHLRSLRKDLSVFVVDADHGLGIVYKKKPETMLSFTHAQIRNLTYDDLDKNRQQWLNLKPVEYFYSLFDL